MAYARQSPDEPLPYYKWFVRDYRANRKVQRMGYIAKGLYRELLDEAWLEGSLPVDMLALADICDCPVETMSKAWDEIGPCFSEVEGRLVNLKLDSMRTEQDATRIKRMASGRLGGIAKLANAKQMLANAKQMLANAKQMNQDGEDLDQKIQVADSVEVETDAVANAKQAPANAKQVPYSRAVAVAVAVAEAEKHLAPNADASDAETLPPAKMRRASKANSPVTNQPTENDTTRGSLLLNPSAVVEGTDTPSHPRAGAPGPKKAADPRHVPCREAYLAYCESAGVDALWDKKAAGALGQLLKKGKGITVERFAAMLRNRSASENANPGDAPHKVIASINEYAQGPLDRFGTLKGKPLNASALSARQSSPAKTDEPWRAEVNRLSDERTTTIADIRAKLMAKGETNEQHSA